MLNPCDTTLMSRILGERHATDSAAGGHLGGAIESVRDMVLNLKTAKRFTIPWAIRAAAGLALRLNVQRTDVAIPGSDNVITVLLGVQLLSNREALAFQVSTYCFNNVVLVEHRFASSYLRATGRGNSGDVADPVARRLTLAEVGGVSVQVGTVAACGSLAQPALLVAAITHGTPAQHRPNGPPLLNAFKRRSTAPGIVSEPSVRS